MKILLPNCFRRKSFDVYNILKLYFDSNSIILAAESKRDQGLSKIMYRTNVCLLREDSLSKYTKDLNFIIDDNIESQIVYIPVEENSTELLLNYVENKCPKNLRYALPSLDSFKTARNKYTLGKFCAENMISAPKIFDDISGIDPTIFTPFIVKPRLGEGGRGHIHIDRLSDIGRAAKINPSIHVFQEKIFARDNVHGGFFLCNNGEVISGYCHQRLRTFPKDGGVTVYSQMTDNVKIIESGKNLLKKLNWCGFAMIEFIKDQADQKYKIIELNPRVWGSFLLSEFGGKHFLINYINLATNQPLIEPSKSSMKKIRWLLMDLTNLLNPHFYGKDFFNFFNKNTCYINWTYSNKVSALLFTILYFFNYGTFRKLISKWKK